MDVPPLPPAGGPSGPVSPPGKGPGEGVDQLFSLGQRLLAQVAQTLGAGQAVLDVGGQRLLVATPIPLAPGQVIQVSVRALVPTLELVMAGPPIQFSPEAYALAAVLTARAEPAGRAPVSQQDVRTFLRLLGQTAAPDADAVGARQQLAKLLLAVDVGRHGAELPEVLRERVLHSGLLLESRVAALAARAHDSRSVAKALDEDVRMLLARIASEPGHSPETVELRQRLADSAAARQIEAALHLVRDGEWRLDIPVTFGDVQTEAQLRVRKEPERGASERGRGGHAIELSVNHPELGPVHAAVRWTPPDLQIRFAVVPDSVAVLTKDTASLVASLRARGFRDVSVTVDVAPELPPPAPDETSTLPGGSILRARA